MRRLGISPESVAEMHVNDPQGFSGLLVVWHCFLSVMRSISISKIKWKVGILSVASWQKRSAAIRLAKHFQARGQDISRANALTSAYAPTAAMQNYNQYAQMLKEDPEGAAAFAAAAGINTNAKKLMMLEKTMMALSQNTTQTEVKSREN